jgi:hypothetical protein
MQVSLSWTSCLNPECPSIALSHKDVTQVTITMVSPGFAVQVSDFSQLANVKFVKLV